MNKLTAKQLLRMNQKLTNEVDETPEMLNRIEEILHLPYQQDENAVYIYKDMIDKASVLGSSIARLRPFEKKNSQTAVIAMLTLLELNDIMMKNYENSIMELVEYLMEGDLLQSSQWVKRYQEKRR
jgi:prophage maintenance system killer protein